MARRAIFTYIAREHCLDWISHMAKAPTQTTGEPLGVISRIQRISGLSQFFRDTAQLRYAAVPNHSLIGTGDAAEVPAEGTAVHPRAGP
ncbi:hypothetical protein [Streptomyces sp. NPDC093149]|uniref:hypothetical protein n=1 Tax=Streptomyces sp. NPDC093149 TaxID=3366031 RepID=UPI003819196D